MKLNVNSCISDLSLYIESRDFRGYDPYDALNSPVARVLGFGLKFGRIAWIQLFRRLPINLRPLLFCAKGHNPKGLGLFLDARPVMLSRLACRFWLAYVASLATRFAKHGKVGVLVT